MRRSRRVRGLAGLFCVLLAAGTLAAQESAPEQSSNKQAKTKPYALIFGTVYGPDDRPFYGAQVKIRLADGKKVKGGEDLMSDRRGEFALRVPAEAADYVIRASAKAGKRKLAGETKVHITFDERMDVGVHLTE